jgi:hypothetical protein
MPLLVMQVAVHGDLLEIFEMSVDAVEAGMMLARANEDERSIDRHGQDAEEGELWVDLIDADGETLLDQVACFHRADAADVLELHFGMAPDVIRDCLSKANIASLYARHRATAQAHFRKVDRLVDCSTSSSRQANRRRLGEASVMDLVAELRRRLKEQNTQLALKELPVSVQSAAVQLAEAAHTYVKAVEQL